MVADWGRGKNKHRDEGGKTPSSKKRIGQKEGTGCLQTLPCLSIDGEKKGGSAITHLVKRKRETWTMGKRRLLNTDLKEKRLPGGSSEATPRPMEKKATRKKKDEILISEEKERLLRARGKGTRGRKNLFRGEGKKNYQERKDFQKEEAWHIREEVTRRGKSQRVLREFLSPDE